MKYICKHVKYQHAATTKTKENVRYWQPAGEIMGEIDII